MSLSSKRASSLWRSDNSAKNRLTVFWMTSPPSFTASMATRSTPPLDHTASSSLTPISRRRRSRTVTQGAGGTSTISTTSSKTCRESWSRTLMMCYKGELFWVNLRTKARTWLRWAGNTGKMLSHSTLHHGLWLQVSTPLIHLSLWESLCCFIGAGGGISLLILFLYFWVFWAVYNEPVLNRRMLLCKKLMWSHRLVSFIYFYL